LNLLVKGFGIDLRKEMPYHETLTVFWMRTVRDFNEANSEKSFLERANLVAIEFDKEYPLRFYSREFLFSDAARAEYLEPDLVRRPVSALS
jgi:hypothetical protein